MYSEVRLREDRVDAAASSIALFAGFAVGAVCMRWLSCHETSERAASQSHWPRLGDWSECELSLSSYLIDHTGRVHLLV